MKYIPVVIFEELEDIKIGTTKQLYHIEKFRSATNHWTLFRINAINSKKTILNG